MRAGKSLFGLWWATRPTGSCIDAGHGGSDPGARGVVEEKEMTAQTSEALLALLEADPNYIPLRSRESYDVTAKPSERAEAINAQSPQLLLSIHGNSAPEGSAAAGFECYPSVPGRTWHQESYYFAQQLAQGMQTAGAKLRGHGGIRYIYYQGEVKQLVESTHTEVRDERSFTLLEDVNCPAVLAEQCFVTSEEDVAQFGSEEGCKTVARVYYLSLIHISEPTRRTPISYAVFCLKKKKLIPAGRASGTDKKIQGGLYIAV